MTEKLPEGWTQARVEDLFCSFSGGTPSKSKKAYWGGEIPWLSSGDIKAERICAGSEFITQAGLDNSSSRVCRPGSVLIVVRSGILKHTLPVSVLAREAAINQDIKCFDSRSDDLNRWLALALRASSKNILALNREGTTVQSVKYDTLRNFQLPIPPLGEQRRIAKALEKLLGEVERSKERMAKIPVLLKRFRQSVLAAACSGRLTADWRDVHSSASDINSVLDGILRRKTSSAKTAREKQAHIELFQETEEEDSDTLPEQWKHVYLNKLCNSFNYGTSSKSRPTGTVPVLRMGNIQGGKIDWKELVYTSDPGEIQKYSLHAKTVLFNRTNSPELVGKTAIYRGERPAIFAGYLIRINPLPELDPEYLNLCLNTNFAREFCQRVKTDGVSQSNINAQKVGYFEVPFCSIEEQQEIVDRAGKLLALADHIEERFQTAKRQVDGLTQSILAKAFRGELVPTEAELAAGEGRDYQSAEQLLERTVASKTGARRKKKHEMSEGKRLDNTSDSRMHRRI